MELSAPVMERVDRAVDRHFSAWYREDAKQEIFVALLAGDIAPVDIDSFVGTLVRRNEGERRLFCSGDVADAALANLTAEGLSNRVNALSKDCGPIKVGGYEIRKPVKFEMASILFKQGKSTREVQKIVGLTPITAVKYRKLALKGITVLCECGRLAGHRGWCGPRYQRSPKRQAWTAQFSSATSA